MALASIRGQSTSNVSTYYVNDGRSHAYDSTAGELQLDLGGFIPFSRYSENSAGGHDYASLYDPNYPSQPSWASYPSTFLEVMKKYALNLAKLDNVVDSTVRSLGGVPTPPPTILPFGSRVVIDPEFLARNVALDPDLPFPFELDAWWDATPGGVPSNSTKRRILFWPYRINGGAMMICVASDGNGQMSLRANQDVPVLLVNYWFHWRDFGTNPNHWREESEGGEVPRAFSGPASGPFMTQEGGRFSNGTEVLQLQAQAIEDGAIVVFCGENFAQNLWITIQRTQEAEAFVRHEWANAPPSPTGSFPAVTAEKVYLDGISWGQLASATLCLLQPEIYSGTSAWNVNDLGLAQCDYYDLQFQLSAVMGHAGWLLSTDPYWTPQWSLVDALGIRFDAPKSWGRPWDLAAFSMNRRPGDLHVPVRGVLGDNEFNFPMHWPSADAATVSNFSPRFHRNWEHSRTDGFIAGVNEYAAWEGNEWSSLRAVGVAYAGSNPDLIPTTAAPAKPYPDPYNETLRHVHVDPIGNPNLLTPIDMTKGLLPAYRDPAASVSPNRAIGHGTWIGMHDTMHVLDLDGDGRMEVVFGNLEGYVHVLEFHPGGYAGDPSSVDDPYRLYEEWRSPYLGQGITSADCTFTNSGALLFFGNSNGEVFRIGTNGPNGYAVGPIPNQPIVSPLLPGGDPRYAGPTPIVLVNDFAGTTSSKELAVLGRFLDWNLYDTIGGSIQGGKLFRPLHGIGPTDAFPVNRPGSNDSNKEILVSASDGHVWWIDYDGTRLPNDRWTEPDAAIPFTGMTIYRIAPVYLNGPSVPSHLLCFGVSADRDNDMNFDGVPDDKVDRIQLWDLATQTLVSDVPAAPHSRFDGFDFLMSFAWVKKLPSQQGGMARFAIATGGSVMVYDLNATSIVLAGSREVTVIDSLQSRYTTCITSLDCANLKDETGASRVCLIFSDCTGRIFVLNEALDYLRDPAKADFRDATVPANYSLAHLPSNRTLGGITALSLEEPATKNGSGTLYFADYRTAPFDSTTLSRFWHVGSIDIGNATGGNQNAWRPYVSDPVNKAVLRATNESPFDEIKPDRNRSMQYEDLDGDGIRELEIFSERGIAWHDTTVSPPRIRRFQTCGWDPVFVNAGGFFGGRVFEHPSRPPTPGSKKDYLALGGFVVPQDALHHAYRSPTTDGWWYPQLGPAFLSGQVESPWQSAHNQGLGVALDRARLRPGGNPAATPTWHVVVGTNGGFVHAIEPGTAAPSGGVVASTLSYSTPDLGSFIVGMDCDDLTGDGVDEIACGCWLDTGTFQDWNAGVVAKNRGKLYLIDTTLPPVVGSWSSGQGIEELTGDSSFGTPGKGIGSSVLGVRIDNVDGDGEKEVWCVDQLHVYLFYKDTTLNAWRVAYRSADLGAFPGYYNNLFPIKDGGGHTVKLLVMSPGYLMEFAVDWTVVP